MTDETPMGSEENGNIVYGNDPANRIKQSPYTMDNLAVNTTYYMRIKSISGENKNHRFPLPTKYPRLTGSIAPFASG